MNAVPDPVVGRRATGRRFKHLLVMHDRRVIFPAQPVDDFVAFDQPGAVLFPVVLLSADRQSKRLAQHQAHVGQSSDRVGKQLIILPLVFFRRHTVVQVIHSHQNAEQVGLEINGIGLPPAREVGNLVAADAPVYKGQIPVRQIVPVFGSNNKLVAVAENVVGVCVSSPIAIRDGVALKKYARPVKEGGHAIFCRLLISRTANSQIGSLTKKSGTKPASI